MVLVTGIERYALHDGPGIRTVVFFKGCPLSCKWCSNPETQSFNQDLYYQSSSCIHCNECIKQCPQHAIDSSININRDICNQCLICCDVCPTGSIKAIAKDYSVDQLLKELLKDQFFYDKSGGGVTFSGGEALSQSTFLLKLLPELKKHNIHVSIETTASLDYSLIESLFPFIDLFLIDIKHMDSHQHYLKTGIHNNKILSNIHKMSSHVPIIIRVPLIDGFNATQDNISQLVLFMKHCHLNEVHLLPYHTLGNSKYTQLNRKDQVIYQTPSKELLTHYKSYFESQNIQCIIGG